MSNDATQNTNEAQNTRLSVTALQDQADAIQFDAFLVTNIKGGYTLFTADMSQRLLEGTISASEMQSTLRGFEVAKNFYAD